jgi:hypothetical protein
MVSIQPATKKKLPVKIIVLLGGCTTLVLLSILPVRAGLFDTAMDFAGGFIESSTGIDISQYTTIAREAIDAIQSRSLDKILGILSKVGSQFGDYKEAMGELGILLPDELEKIVNQAIDDQKQSEISSGANNGVGPLPTFEKRAIKEAVQIAASNATIDTILGADGQKLIMEQRQDQAKITAGNIKAAASAQKKTATQDVEKLQSTQLASIGQNQQYQLEEALQTRLATYEGNKTELQQLEHMQQEDWEKQIQFSSAQVQGQYIGSTVAGFLAPAPEQPSAPEQANQPSTQGEQ